MIPPATGQRFEGLPDREFVEAKRFAQVHDQTSALKSLRVTSPLSDLTSQ